MTENVPNSPVSVSLDDQNGGEEFTITSFSVPVKHPAAFTFTSSDIFDAFQKKFYSICTCLPPEVEDDLGCPEGCIEITYSPKLKGEKLIENVEELRQIAADLLSKPIFAKVNCYYERTTSYGAVETTKFRSDRFVAVVDTGHVYIKGTLKRYLDQAISLMEKGVNFCLKIDFGATIARCIKQYLEPGKVGGKCNFSDGLALYLTNHSKPSCEHCLDPQYICVAFPFWMCGGSCYFAYRTKGVKHIEYDFPGIPTKFLTEKGVIIFFDSEECLKG